MRVENKKRFIAFYRKSLKMKFVLVFRCWTLRWYTPATTRRKHIPVGSLMSSLTSNGRVRGVPTQRRKLRVAEGFTSSGSECVGGLGCRVVPTVGFQG